MTEKQRIELSDLNDPRVVAKALLDQQATIIEQNTKIIELLSTTNTISRDLHDVVKSVDWKIWEYFRPESER